MWWHNRARAGIYAGGLSFCLLGAALLGACGEERPRGGDGDGGDGGDDTSASSSQAGSGGSGVGGAGGAGGMGAGGAGGAGGSGGGSAAGDPPFGGSSKGSGGPAPVSGDIQQAGNIAYRLLVPSSPAAPSPLLIVYSGTEGGAQMTNNLQQVAAFTKTDKFIRAILDGKTYFGDGGAGATVLDDVRAKYDIDNDRTYLLGESAGTTAALELGFSLRQSYFAAYWANDINAVGAPGKTAAALGFQPWGQVGPGGQQALAEQIVAGMEAAGYRLPNPAPYAGSGFDTHGHPDQFIAAGSWFPGKSRTGP